MAEAATNGVQQMAMMMLNPQFAAQQQKFALQQAMAQEMMKQGSEEPPTNQLANPGGMVAQNSPWAALSRAVEKGVGAYSAQKAIGDQLAMATQAQQNKGPQDPNAPTDEEGLKALAYGDKLATAGYENRTAGNKKALEQAQTPVNMNGHMTFMTPPALQNSPKAAILPPTQAAASSSNTVTPSSPPPAPDGANPSPMSPQGNGGSVDFNNPVSVKGAEAGSTELITGDRKYLNETLLPAKDAAMQANSNIGALQQAATIANSNDLTHTGPTAPSRIGFLKNMNDFLSSTGGTPLDQNEIASADAINKIGLRLTANMTKMLGSREAAQIFSKIQEANPNWYMQPKTLNLVSNLIKGDNDTAIGRYKAGYATASKGGLAQDGVNAFDAQDLGKANVKKAFAASGMAGIDDPKSPDFQQLSSGSQFYDLIPNSPTYGKLLIKH